MRNLVIVDTGAVLSLFNKADQRHDIVARFFYENDCDLITTSSVVTEALYFFRKQNNIKLIQAVLTWFVTQFQTIYEIDQNELLVISALMTKYHDVPMDYTDATLVSLAESLGQGRILTLDSDFEIYRWGNNKSFENLLRL